MRLLSIGTDRSLFEEGSAVHSRLLAQASLLDGMHVVVFSRAVHQLSETKIGERIIVTPTSTKRIPLVIRDAYRIGARILSAGGSWIVTAQDPFETGLVAWILSRKYKLPLHLQVHTDIGSKEWRTESLLNRVRGVVARFLLPRADAVRVVSERVATGVEKMGVPRSRIVVVPIHVPVEEFAQRKPAFDLHRSYPMASHIFLAVSRFAREKDIPMLLRAFADARRQERDALLLLVGSGPEKERIALLARTLGLGESLRFVPWARDVASYYKTADTYLLSSRYEGWGMSVVEAMACGIPIIMTEVGCVGELVKDGENGLVVPVGDHEMLADAMLWIARHPKQGKKLGEAGQRAVAHLATKEASLELYKKSWDMAVRNFELHADISTDRYDRSTTHSNRNSE